MVNRHGEVIVRAPKRAPLKFIEKMVEERGDWIAQALARVKPQTPPRQLSTKEKLEFKILVRERADFFAELMNVKFKKLSIRKTFSRWGSCSREGNISISQRLILAPREILDYVIVHEMSHLTHHNHSQNFWREVGQYFSHYKQARKWLRDNGNNINI